jgi:hypothetical protein
MNSEGDSQETPTQKWLEDIIPWYSPAAWRAQGIAQDKQGFKDFEKKEKSLVIGLDGQH